MLDPIELMAERADELEQTYENNVMLPGLPAPGMLSFKTEPGLPVPYTGGAGTPRTPVTGQLVPNEKADPRLSQSTGMVTTGNDMTLAELDKVYDQATEEVLDALFLIDEDLNSGLDILSNSITTYNGKSMRLQIQQRDLLKDMGKIFRDWWEVSERERKKPTELKTADTDVAVGGAGDVKTEQSTTSDSGGFDLGGNPFDSDGKKDDKKNDKRDKPRRRPKGKFGKILGFGMDMFSKAKDFVGGNAGKLALGAGAGYLAYNALSDDREENVMTPEQVAAKQKADRTGTLMDPEDGHQITWDEYDAKYGQAKTSELSTSADAPNASAPVVLEPGQASIPSRVQDVSDVGLSTSQMVGAAGLTALGGATAAQTLRNRQLKPSFNMNPAMSSPDVPRANVPKLDAPKAPKKGMLNTLKKVPKLGALSAVLGAADIYGTATDDSLSGRDKTTGIADSAGQMGAYAATLALGPAAPFAMAAMLASDGLSFAGDLMGYDIPSISGTVGAAASSAAGGIYDFFGFGDEPTEENVQTAAALTSDNVGSAVVDDSELANLNHVVPTAKSEKIKELQKVIETNTSSSVATNPVQAVVEKQKQTEGLGAAIAQIQAKPAIEKKESESIFNNSIFQAAAGVVPGLGVANALYDNTNLSDITNLFTEQSTSSTNVDNVTGDSFNSSSDVSSTSANYGKKVEKQSFFGGMLDSVKGAASAAYDFTPMGMVSNMITSPAITETMSSVVSNMFGDEEQNNVSTNQSQSSVADVDTVQVTANAVEVTPATESTERSNFTTIKEAAAPVVDNTKQEPIIVHAPAPKKEPKPKTQIVKQVVQPRPTIDDTPTMIGNGGLGLIGNSIV